MNKLIKYMILNIAFIGICSLVAGCATVDTAISHRHLTTQTKMSEPVFLNPVSKREKSVYVAVENTSDKPNLHLKSLLTRDLKQKGYRIESNPRYAHYLLQANVLKIVKTNPNTAHGFLGSSYGEAISGALVGGTTGALVDNSSATGSLAGSLIGGLAGTVAHALVKDNVYVVVTDIQISQRVGKGQVIQKTASAFTQGTDSTTTQFRKTRTDWQRYRTRVVSTADKVNLTFDKAKDLLMKQLANSISGIFNS